MIRFTSCANFKHKQKEFIAVEVKMILKLFYTEFVVLIFLCSIILDQKQ
jgi:hypothetical protein